MEPGLTDEDLARIESRLRAVQAVAPAPWQTRLESEGGLGGSSFIQFAGETPGMLDELYLEVFEHDIPHASLARSDIVVKFVGESLNDVSRLLREVRRLRDRLAREEDGA